MFVLIVLRHFVQVYPNFEIDVDRALAGINTPFQCTQGGNIALIQSFLL